MKFFLHAKIHRATVTQANVDYIGSITIDEDLMDAVGIEEFQKVLVTSATAGGRLETYVIKGERGSGKICMNGPAAHVIKKGEIVVIMGFELSDKPILPKVIMPSEDNRSYTYLEQ